MSAATFNDDGVTALYQELRGLLADQGMPVEEGVLPRVATRQSTRIATIVPASRVRYLAEISDTREAGTMVAMRVDCLVATRGRAPSSTGIPLSDSRSRSSW